MSYYIMFFFFKQKTAYEMRISDWSSDVCSSDLTQVGLVAPEGIQHLLRRTVGPHRAERLLLAGELVQADAALAMGLVDELVEIDHVATRARVWLEQMLQLPRGPMLETRRIARADLVAALDPERIGMEPFIEGRSEEHTSELQS